MLSYSTKALNSFSCLVQECGFFLRSYWAPKPSRFLESYWSSVYIRILKKLILLWAKEYCANGMNECARKRESKEGKKSKFSSSMSFHLSYHRKAVDTYGESSCCFKLSYQENSSQLGFYLIEDTVKLTVKINHMLMH